MKKLFNILATIFLTVAIVITPTKVFAADAWAIAAEALGVLAAYNSALREMLALGNNVNAQMGVRKQDIDQNGSDPNKHDIETVDSIMTRLVNDGDYALRVNSLPFVWTVNNSDKFNASCYPMNYITINRGLVRGLNCDENQLAAVLAHEMTHGIQQHSAKTYAQAIAQQLGAMMIGANIESNSRSANIDWGKLSGMVGYSVAKNINVPAEYEADERGFYIMTSAGFNPGGGAAAMNRLDYYVRYETRDFLEFNAHDTPSDMTFSDHPDTDKREQKLSDLMTEYGGGHVSVRKDDRAYKVFVDGREIFYSVNIGDDPMSAARNAYYFAGGLSRAFHDYDSIDGWNFRAGTGNQTDFLNDEFAYRELRELSHLYNLGDKIKTVVELAYKYEDPRTRERIAEKEAERKAYWDKIRTEAAAAKKKHAEKLRVNADIYNDYGQGELALKEIERAINAQNQDDIAECLAIRGRAKAICGDYDGALVDSNAAVTKDPKNLFNFLNRADVYHMRGELDLAHADIKRAIAINEKVAVTYKLQGDIFDEQANTEAATESYRKCYELSKKNVDAIPINYLEKIDPKAAEKIHKAEEKAREQAEAAKKKRAEREAKERAEEEEKNNDKD